MATTKGAPTQQFVEIASIESGVVFLKSGGLRKILMVSGINFDLKSEGEQQVIVYAYQSFLDSLDFSIQQIVHSRKLNIENYLKKITDLEQQETNETIKYQLGEYREFVRSFVGENPIMMKTFFVVVPFDAVQLAEVGRGLGGFFSKKTSAASASDAEKVAKISQLEQRVERVAGGLQHIGLRAVPLEDEELIELFYNLYNPESVEKLDLEIAKQS